MVSIGLLVKPLLRIFRILILFTITLFLIFIRPQKKNFMRELRDYSMNQGKIMILLPSYLNLEDRELEGGPRIKPASKPMHGISNMGVAPSRTERS
jgi:hypothetical protein